MPGCAGSLKKWKRMPEKAELLSPAGSMEALRAAVSAGADAVYLGASSHGARASAGFDDASLKAAIRFAHLYGRRAYVTVNTLIKERETDSLRGLIRLLAELQADAVIVQDLGVLSLIREEFPGVVVHASTQMSVHNARGAGLLLDLGVSRAVAARECSLTAIRAIAQTGIKTEVFVHGAMCVSVSGQCLFSSQIGGRSGNRGRCAQPCRLQYAYRDVSGPLLSMRDMNTLEHLPALLRAGANSFKIEGRLKRPEYVQIVTCAYRRALDAALSGKESADAEASHKALEQIFSRGFTAGHALNEEDAQLISMDGVSHRGVRIGRITSIKSYGDVWLAQAHLTQPLGNGDGLAVRGKAEQEMIYSGPAVTAGQQAVLRLRERVSPGDEVFRLQDEAQLKTAREAASRPPEILYDAELRLCRGKPAALTLKSRDQAVEVSGDIPDEAVSQPLDEAAARRFIFKSGGTPFTPRSFAFSSGFPAFMTAKALNALRREGLDKLQEALIGAHRISPPQPYASGRPAHAPLTGGVPRLYALMSPRQDREALLRAGTDRIILAPDDFRGERLAAQLGGAEPGDVLMLPRQISDEAICNALPLIRETGCLLMADNVGQLRLTEGSPFLTGEGVPVWNGASLRLLRDLGAKAAVISRELSGAEIADLPGDAVELILPVYGRTALMQLNHCPERVRLGLSRNRAGCTLCDQGRGLLGNPLLDRFSCAYPLIPTHFDEGCLISLYHHQPLHLSELAPRMSWLADVRQETQEEAERIIGHYAALQKGGQGSLSRRTEPGRFLSGVE